MILLGLYLVSVQSNVIEIDATAEKYMIETGKRVSVKIQWNAADAATFYRIFRRKGTEEWQSISTFDDASEKRVVRVLNAFPSEHSSCSERIGRPSHAVLTSQFVYADGTSLKTSKSSALKVWMEGGSIDGVKFDGYGRDQATGELFIEVDVIPSDDLDLEPELIWNYDMVVFGTWDGSGTREYLVTDCNVPETNLVNELERYLSLGYSVIASHDTMGLVVGTLYGISRLRSYFAIKVGGTDKSGYNDFDANNVEMVNMWGSYSQSAEVVRRGQVVDFPWSIPSDRTIEVKRTHTYGNIAMGDVWLRLVYDSSDKNWEFQYNLPGADVMYYLTTNNNTAMIQTGHDNCNATEIERKLWANLIVSMKQRTTSTFSVDHSCIDEDVPVAPVCDCSIYEGNYSIQCNAEDAEAVYEYLVEGYDDMGALIGASSTSVNAASGIDYFIYHVDTKSTMSQNDLLAKTSRLLPGEKITGSWYSANKNACLHILAVDRSGNPSSVTDLSLSECSLMTDVFECVTSSSTRAQVCHLFTFPCLYAVNL